MGSLFGQREDAKTALSQVDSRRSRLASMSAEPWPRFLARIALSIVVLFVLAQVAVALFER